MFGFSNSYGPSAPQKPHGSYEPPKLLMNSDRSVYKTALREWITIHKSVKDFDKKRMAVYVTAGYRILRSIPEPVQHTLRQKQAAEEINYMTTVGEQDVEEIPSIITNE